jgi:preprotein translocase subunit SecG
VSELNSPLTFLLVINSVITIFFILNQNESAKDSANTQNSSSSSSSFQNPFENVTWVCLGLQFILLMIKVKVPEF